MVIELIGSRLPVGNEGTGQHKILPSQGSVGACVDVLLVLCNHSIAQIYKNADRKRSLQSGVASSQDTIPSGVIMDFRVGVGL